MTIPDSFSIFRTRHEALQKLAIFFQHTKEEFGDLSESGGATPTKYSNLLSIILNFIFILTYTVYLFLTNVSSK